MTINGALIEEEQLSAQPMMRGIYYGDGLFESIRMHQGQLLFWAYHRDRLSRGMQFLGMTFPDHKTMEDLPNVLHTTCGDWKNARIRLTLIRSAGGLYTPSDNQVHILAEAIPLSGKPYTTNKTGWKLGIYPEQLPLAGSPLSNLKTCNSLPYILAAQYRQEKGFDDVLIINQRGNIVEGTAYNFFCRKADTLFTPPLSEGCLDGVIRRIIIEKSKELNWTIKEQPITPDFLSDANSIYLTNAIQGVKWVERLGEWVFEKEGTDVLQQVVIGNS